MISAIKTVLFVLLTFVVSASCMAAKTYQVVSDVFVFDSKDGERVDTWQTGTLFTSNDEDDLWIRVTGTFPNKKWRTVDSPLFIERTDAIEERIPYKNIGGRTIVYPALEQRYVDTSARKFKLLESSPLFDTPEQSTAKKPVDTWQQGRVFTSAEQTASYIKVTGIVEDEKWQALPQPKWLFKPVKVQDITQPKPYVRNEQARRFAVIDKTKFQLTIYEQTDDNIEKLMRAPVALGYDRCLSKEKGGQCYYTPEGQFNIDFKLFDPDGIHWCIPKKMEAEFKNKIAQGERCWRGIMGRHALNFGDSLFLHGTSNPNSIGGNTTHGCIRLRNADIAMIYRLLTNGDQIFISDKPSLSDITASL